MMAAEITITTTDETGLSDEASATVRLVAHLAEAARCMRDLGLTREMAAERSGAAILAAWPADDDGAE